MHRLGVLIGRCLWRTHSQSQLQSFMLFSWRGYYVNNCNRGNSKNFKKQLVESGSSLLRERGRPIAKFGSERRGLRKWSNSHEMGKFGMSTGMVRELSPGPTSDSQSFFLPLKQKTQKDFEGTTSTTQLATFPNARHFIKWTQKHFVHRFWHQVILAIIFLSLAKLL